ncbi:MAG: class I SAM-dependent methyltransferase [Pseudohongiellaceae bacterium]
MRTVQQRLAGLHALHLQLPLSGMARRWRRCSRRLRGKKARGLQSIRLPQTSWRHVTCARSPRLLDTVKVNGNVRNTELAILSAVASELQVGDSLFEIGTFDGRTTINLAAASLRDCEVHTLDLPPDLEPAYALDSGERHMVDKPESGQRIRAWREVGAPFTARIHQHFGDSATFDYTPFEQRCGLVFVDGSHARDYVLSDTYAAFRMLRPGGMVLWHDYGIWQDVTDTLDELAERERLDLRCIRGTSLVYWRKPQ